MIQGSGALDEDAVTKANLGKGAINTALDTQRGEEGRKRVIALWNAVKSCTDVSHLLPTRTLRTL